jgi:hypothetical protein
MHLQFLVGGSCQVGTMSEPFWRPRKFAGISFAMSLLQVTVFLAVILLVQKSLVDVTIGLKIVLAIWLFGGAGSVIFALIGLIADTRKAAAIGALFAAVGSWLLCGSPIMLM